MGTRSRVAFETENGIVSTYIHWDGYVTGVGGTLLRHYNDAALADKLSNVGFLSSLRATLEESRENTVEHNRDVQPVLHTHRDELLKYTDECWGEYCYLFIENENTWLVAEMGDGVPQIVWQSLEVAHAADMAGAA